jgi:hypothetical protein
VNSSTENSADRPAQGELSARDRRILTFEEQRWRYPGAKEQAIRAEFGISATRYYQILNGLLDRPEALRQHPMLINRLRRLREARQRARSTGTRRPAS